MGGSDLWSIMLPQDHGGAPVFHLALALVGCGIYDLKVTPYRNIKHMLV